MDEDSYTPLTKQYSLIRLILTFYTKGNEAIANGADMNKLFGLKVKERIGRAKYIPNDESEQMIQEIEKELISQIKSLYEGGDEE
jgi:V/A-type H+-transporting ATPase subunit A